MSTRLDLIRQSDIAPVKRNSSKHNTSDNSSMVAMKRKIHARVATQAKGNTLFGMYNSKTRDGSAVASQKPNRGDQSSYLYFKSIFPSMSLNSVTKQ